MAKKMEEVEVYVGEDNIVIMKQPNPSRGDSTIVLNPLQIDIVIEWLKEAKEEALNK
jgi:hypothetical protein